MRLRLAAVLPLLLAVPAAADDAARVAYLKTHAAPLKSIDPADEDFADLEPVRKAVGDSRIVLLSEQTHGDGATFHARTRLIKFLHQKCGFDVLAFESGLYDCRKAWELLREGRMPARDAVSQGVFQIWTGAEEIQPIIRYLGDQAKGPRPLEVAGFDCQFSGPAGARFLPAELTAVLGKLPPGALTAEQQAAAVASCKQLANYTTAAKPDTAALAAARTALAAAKPSDALPAAELAFWRQVLDSSVVLAEMQAAQAAGPKSERNPINLRDAQMARNLVWLARERYPRRKILVWAAAFHLLRNAETLAMVSDPGKTPAERKTSRPYTQIRPMGGEAWKDIEKETYSIFFTAAEGEFQTLRMPRPQKLRPLIDGSIEDLLIRAGQENAFLDLRGRGPDGTWLTERLVARPVGNADAEADWTKVCDGLVFTRKMYPATQAKIDLAAIRYYPTRDPAALGVPFDRYTTKDSFDRTITFYLSHAPKSAAKNLPLAVFIAGSGGASVFTQRDGKVYGGLQNLLLAAGQGRFRVLVVEKPGVTFGVAGKHPGSAIDSPAEFRREHTLPRWVEANNAAVRAAQRLDGIDWTRTLAVGHSEGGIVATHLAAANPLVTHVAVLAGGGPSQLFDFLHTAAQPKSGDRSPADANARVRQFLDGWAKVQADPDSADKLWLGHPHRRWSSFLKTSPVEGLLASRAVVYAAHGTADTAVPVTSFDILRAELLARGRDLTAERLTDADHGFRKPDDAPGSVRGFEDVLGRVAAWFHDRPSPTELAIQKDLQRLQGTWQMLPTNAAAASTMQVVITGDTRAVRNGDTVLTQSRFRIDPLATPPTIDILVATGPMRGQTLQGIYAISGDKLRLCLASDGGPRPREFAADLGAGHVLQELKRAAGNGD